MARDLFEWLEEQTAAESVRRWQARVSAEIEEESDLMRRCMALEGEWSFWKWWNPSGERGERIARLRARLGKHEASVAGDSAGVDLSVNSA